MQMESMELGLYRTNCYILWETDAAVVIDPGYSAQRILARLHDLGLTLRAIVLTHGHFDHVGAVGELKKAIGCPVWLPAPDTGLPEEITNGPIPYTDTFTEGDTLCLGDITLSVMLTPGHTPGSCCLKTGNLLFTGDTLFRDTCGRTDLPGGDWRQMRASLRRLAAIGEELFVYPGHGDATTLSREKRFNPYLRGM